MTEDVDNYEYRVVKCDTHEHLEQSLNAASEFYWEPVSYSVWSVGSSVANHFVILRRDARWFRIMLKAREDRLEDETDPSERKRIEDYLKRAGRGR